MKVTEHVPFSLLTTFRAGSNARYVIDIESPLEIRDAFEFAKKIGYSTYILGGGSNTLGNDSPLQAAIVRSMHADWSAEDHGDHVSVCVGAGMSWDALVALAVSHGWFGIENLSSIPGTVGGAIAQNIGAYGAVLSDTLAFVRAYDVVHDEHVTLTKEQCAFGYRTSIFKKILETILLVTQHLISKKMRPSRFHMRGLQKALGMNSQHSKTFGPQFNPSEAKNFHRLRHLGLPVHFF